MSERLVVIRQYGRYVMQVNERTRKSTGLPQQFVMVDGVSGSHELKIAPPDQWVDDPEVVDINGIHLR